jgi:cytohesin
MCSKGSMMLRYWWGRASVLVGLLALLTAGCAPPRFERLCRAAMEGDKAQVERILTAHPDLLEYQEARAGKVSILHVAAAGGKREVVEDLLAKGASPSLLDANQRTPLHWAALNGKKDAAELLIAKGADPNAPDAGHSTPLYWAAAMGRKDVVELLLDKGANPNARCFLGRTPLDLPAARGDQDTVALLLAKGADVQARDKGGSTVLHYAAQGSSTDLVKLLLDKGVDPNAKNGMACTPLHFASIYGRADNAEALLAKGADPKAVDQLGRQPLHCAAFGMGRAFDAQAGRMPEGKTLVGEMAKGRAQIVKMLLDRGVDPNAKDAKGNTPLSLASSQRYTDIVALLKKPGEK